MKKLIALSVFTVGVFLSFSANADNTVQYPSRAWNLGQSGYVKALYDVDRSGKVIDVRIKESEPKFIFDDAVKEQVYKWKFPKNNPITNVSIKVTFESN